MMEPATRQYVVLLKNDRVKPDLRGQLRSQTKASFGSAADAFARDIARRLDRGDLPGVVAVDNARSGSLPMVFVTATKSGAEMLGRDERVKAISAG